MGIPALSRLMSSAAFILALAIGLLAWPLPAPAADPLVIQRETRSKSFDDVVFELEFAITQRNFRISARNDIARGIRARGVENVPNALIIHFCNLAFAREALEIDPLLLTYMPCRVAVYEHRDRVVVSTMRLPADADDPRANAFARKINGMLHQIIDFAVQ
ncbi:MAG: DUF302 domain-containing protein [Gammaproteobacteria bacterium]